MRLEPQAMVQPIWPWPVLSQRLASGLGPMIGGPSGVIGRRQAQYSGRSKAAARGEQLARDFQHMREIARFEAGVVAGEIRGGGQAQPVAQPGKGDEVRFIDAEMRRCRFSIGNRQGDRIALHRIDRQGEAEGLGQQRAVAAERQDIGVALDPAPIGLDAGDAAAAVLDPLDRRAELEGDAALAAGFGEREGELAGVAGFIMRRVDGAGETVLHRGEGRFEGGELLALERAGLDAFIGQ